MNKKEKLQEKISRLQKQLHDIEVADWWSKRPHVLEFECGYNSESSDEGTFNNYFCVYGTVLNYEWIKYNGIEWQTFCDHLNIPLYPDEDVLSKEAQHYLQNIKDLEDYEIDYPNFVDYDEKTMRNPNYAN